MHGRETAGNFFPSTARNDVLSACPPVSLSACQPVPHQVKNEQTVARRTTQKPTNVIFQYEKCPPPLLCSLGRGGGGLLHRPPPFLKNIICSHMWQLKGDNKQQAWVRY
jgi:hypothetical protein